MAGIIILLELDLQRKSEVMKMHLNVKGIKDLIRECMRELNEGGCANMPTSHRATFSDVEIHHSNQEEIPDEDMAATMWKSFVDEALAPDSSFREGYVLRALAENPKILEIFLDGVAEDTELQEELYKAVNDLKNSH